MTGTRIETRLEKRESKDPAQCGRVLQMTLDEDDPSRKSGSRRLGATTSSIWNVHFRVKRTRRSGYVRPVDMSRYLLPWLFSTGCFEPIAAFPLFVAGLGALGLLNWRKKRLGFKTKLKSQSDVFPQHLRDVSICCCWGS